MTYVITTEIEIQQKSGANVNTDFNTTAMENAELRGIAKLNLISKHNWVDAVPTSADVKAILSDYVSSFVAIEAINFDMSGYTSRAEAKAMIDVLRDGMLTNQSILRDKKAVTFITTHAT